MSNATKVNKRSGRRRSNTKVKPPLVGEIRETKPSVLASVGETLSRFPAHHFVCLTVLGALVAVAWVMVKAGRELTGLAVAGALVLALLIVGFGAFALFRSNSGAKASEEYRDGASQPRNGGGRQKET
jgi:hypothetical protein